MKLKTAVWWCWMGKHWFGTWWTYAQKDVIYGKIHFMNGSGSSSGKLMRIKCWLVQEGIATFVWVLDRHCLCGTIIEPETSGIWLSIYLCYLFTLINKGVHCGKIQLYLTVWLNVMFCTQNLTQLTLRHFLNGLPCVGVIPILNHAVPELL